MSTTFANSIDNNPIYADRAEHDAAGNDLQTTYATKAELPEFSQAEQDAMDSGIDSTKVSNYDNHLADTTIHVTSADKTAWNAKEDASNKKQSIDSTSTTDYPSSKATADFVNSSVATATANFLGNYTLTDLGLTYPATDAQIETALDGYTFSQNPTNNDYVYVEIQNPQTTGIDDSVERFKFNGTQWLYEYTLNNSSFTAAEKAAIDSGITSSDVSAYNAHVADTDIHVTTGDKSTWNGKQDAISDLSTIRSGASAGATAVQPGDLATVATTGDYADLLNKPTIPTVPVQDVTVDGTSVLNAQGVAEITMPTIPVTDVEVGGSSVVNAQGVAEITFPTIPVTDVEVDGTSVVNNGVAEITMPAVPVQDVTVDGTSVLNAQGVAEITMPTFTQAQADWTESDTTDPSYIQNKPTLAAVATSGAYSDLSGTPTINNVPAVTSSDDSKVLKASYSGGVGSYSWEAESGGTVTDVEVDGTSVVSGGVASITMPTELVPTVTSSDDGKVLKAAYSGGTGSYSWETESGGSDAVFVTWDDTSAGWTTMWTQVQAALSGNKDVFLKDGFCVAELVATNPSQVNFRGLANSTGVPPKITYNYYYLQSSFAHKDVQDQYVLPYPGSGSTGQLLGLVSSNDPPYREPGWVTVSPGPTYSAGTGIDITNNVISADTSVLATKSEIPAGVPAVTSSDDSKVLKATYSGGTGSYSWETESGGGGADWDAQSGEPGYIENKPVPKTLVAGTGITVTENSTQLVVASANQLYSAGNGLTLNNATFAVDTSVVATLNDIPTVDQTYDGTSANAQSGIAVASGISDAVAALPTNLSSAQIQALKEALGVDETVLWTVSTWTPGDNQQTYNLNESPLNFSRIGVYINRPIIGSPAVVYTEFDTGILNTNSITSISVPISFVSSSTHYIGQYVVSGILTTTWTDEKSGQVQGGGTGYTQGYYAHIYKIVGIHRIASN